MDHYSKRMKKGKNKYK